MERPAYVQTGSPSGLLKDFGFLENLCCPDGRGSAGQWELGGGLPRQRVKGPRRRQLRKAWEVWMKGVGEERKRRGAHGGGEGGGRGDGSPALPAGDRVQDAESQPHAASGVAPAADKVGDTPPTPTRDNCRSDSLPAPSSGVVTMVICVPGPEPGTGRVRAREGLGGSEGTDQGGSRALSPLGCGPGGLRGEEGVSPLPPPESPAAGGTETGAGTGVGRGSPSPGAARPAALPPVSLPSGFHGAGRRLPRRPTARTSQSAWSCGSSSPLGWRQGVGGAGGRAPGLRRRLPQSAQAPAARVLATVPAPAPAPVSSRLRGDAPWGRAPPVKDGDAAGKAGPRGAEGGRSLGRGREGGCTPTRRLPTARPSAVLGAHAHAHSGRQRAGRL